MLESLRCPLSYQHHGPKSVLTSRMLYWIWSQACYCSLGWLAFAIGHDWEMNRWAKLLLSAWIVWLCLCGVNPITIKTHVKDKIMDDRPTFWRDTGASLVSVRQTEIKLHPAYNVNRLQATSQSQVRACLHSQPRTSLQRHHLLKRGYYITLHYITANRTACGCSGVVAMSIYCIRIRTLSTWTNTVPTDETYKTKDICESNT